MKLEQIPLDKIDIIPSFNIRTEFGEDETRDLEESIKSTDGNIQPILLSIKDNRYELISGERRYRALKKLGYSEASCIVYDNLSDIQKSQLMWNENLGRKNLSWKEEVKAVKKLKSLGFDISIEAITKHKKITVESAWSLLKALEAIEEFPDLINEKTRKACLDKFKNLKKLSEEKQVEIQERKITIKEALNFDREHKQQFSSAIVIDELKQEVNHYKQKLKDIYPLVKNLDKVERLSNGVWLSDEIKNLVEAARTCETFGTLDEKDKECILCLKESPNIYAKCEFYRDEIEVKK